MAVPATIVYFTMYEQFKTKLKTLLDKKDHTPIWLPMLAGASARVFAATLISPLELIRTKMQSTRHSYREVGDAVKNLIQSRGVIGLWMGIGPTLLRDVPFSAIYWGCYETFKQQFNAPEPSFLFSFCAGASSGAVAALCTLPFDVVKTHRQLELGENLRLGSGQKHSHNTSPTKTHHVLKNIYLKSGINGLFAGISPRLIKVVPACAIMISSYEVGKRFFRRYNAKRYEAR